MPRSSPAMMPLLRPLLPLLLVANMSFMSSAAPQPQQESVQPSSKLAEGDLSNVPADSLRAWVLDLTWLTEQLRADLRLADIRRLREVDSLSRRLDQAQLFLQVEKERRPSWWEPWLLPVAVTAGVLAGTLAGN